MRKSESVVNLDPISNARRHEDGIIGRFFKTKHFGGKRLNKCDDFGHYLFCGKQGSVGIACSFR